LGVEGLAKPVELQLRQQIEGLQLISLAGSSWRNESDLTSEMVIAALGYILDERSYPLVLMCPTGTLQTSVVVGCLRKLQRWTLSSIVEECDCFVLPPAIKVQRRVVEFIEEFALEECFTDPKLRSIWRWRMQKRSLSNPNSNAAAVVGGRLQNTPGRSVNEGSASHATPAVPIAGLTSSSTTDVVGVSGAGVSLEAEEFASGRQHSAIAVGVTSTFTSASGGVSNAAGAGSTQDQSPLRPVSNLSVSSLQGEGRGFSAFEQQSSDQLFQQQFSEQGIGSSLLRDSASAVAVAGTPKSTREQMLRETPTGSPGSASDGEQSRIGAGVFTSSSNPPTALLIKLPKWFENQLDMDDADVEALRVRRQLQGQGTASGGGNQSSNPMGTFSVDQKTFEKKIDFDLLRFARNPPSITTRCKYDKDTILDDDDD
jgi:hypothetical protein